MEAVLAEAVWLEAARMLFEVGEAALATQLSHTTGDKGRVLVNEFRNIM